MKFILIVIFYFQTGASGYITNKGVAMAEFNDIKACIAASERINHYAPNTVGLCQPKGTEK